LYSIRCCCWYSQEHDKTGGRNPPAAVAQPRHGSRRKTVTAVQVQENYHTHTANQVQDWGSAARPDEVADRSGVPSISGTSADMHPGRHQVLAFS